MEVRMMANSEEENMFKALGLGLLAMFAIALVGTLITHLLGLW